MVKPSSAQRPSNPPHGVLAPPPSGLWDLKRAEPRPALVPYVAWMWSVTWDMTEHGRFEQSTLPHPSSHLVVENGEPTIHGPSRGRFTRILEGKGQVVAAKFEPAGLRPFLTGPATELVDQRLPAERVLATLPSDLGLQITACRNGDRALSLLQDALTQAVSSSQLHSSWRAEVERINRIVELVATDRSITNVADLADAVEVHPRSLQRDLANYVGLGPKTIISRYRLQEAAAAALSPEDTDWSAKANELGYYDQAHLIRDFTRTVGMAPATYARNYQQAKPAAE